MIEKYLKFKILIYTNYYSSIVQRMNSTIYNLVKKLINVTLSGSNYYIPDIKQRVNNISSLIEKYQKEQYNNILQEFKKEIFILLVIIAECPNINREFVVVFSDLLIEVIDEETKQKHDVSDLISALDNLSISFNLDKGFSKMSL